MLLTNAVKWPRSAFSILVDTSAIITRYNQVSSALGLPSPLPEELSSRCELTREDAVAVTVDSDVSTTLKMTFAV